MDGGSLGFNVLLFTGLAIATILVLMFRRASRTCGRAELGGPWFPRVATVFILIFFWLTYIVVYSLQVYGVIDPKF